MSSTGFTLWLGTEYALLLPPTGTPVKLQAIAEDGRIMQALCRAAPYVPLRIICDSPQIRLQPLTLPPVGWLDRRKLLAREIGSHEVAIALPHNQLVSLDGDPVLSFWLTQIASLPNPFGGLSLTPVILTKLLTRLQPTTLDWHMVLAWSESGGLRQVVLHQGQIFLTRQFSISDPQQLATEIPTTTTYLARHGLTDSSQLHVTAILPNAMHSIVQSLIHKDRLRFMTPETLAQQVGISRTDQFELLIDYWSSRHWPNLLPAIPASLRSRYQSQRVERGCRRVSAAIWFGLLITLGWQSANLLTLLYQNKKLTSQNKQLAANYHVAYKPVAALIAPLAAMRQAEARQALFQSPSVTPATLVSQIQTNWPDAARLQKLEWQCPDGKASAEQLTLQLSTSKALPIELLQAALPDYQASVMDNGTEGTVLQIRRQP